ncbi:MAG: trigger factor [Thermodesulfobacteriota bacterium]|jgi:trigger factor|nr:trigger factor [Thermodesulfobacteriota bacterium]
MSGVNVKVEDVSSVKKKLQFEIEAAKVDAEIEKAYKKIGKTAKVKGFRAGKVPRSVLEKYYAADMEHQVLNRLINDSYLQALMENKIAAVSDPEMLDSGSIEKGSPFTYSLQVEVKPEIEVKDYEGLVIEKEKFEFDEKFVDEQIAEMRNSRAETLVSEHDKARGGDIAVIDFEGFVDGEAFQNGSAENYELELGSGTFLPGFEEQIVGMGRGEEREIQVEFPQDYGVEDLAGKPAVFKVTLKEIKERRLPEVDDAFARQFGAEDVDALREKIKEAHITQETRRIEAETRERVIKALLERNPIEVPDVMVADQLKQMYEDARRRLSYQGMSMEMLGMNEDMFAEQYHEQAAEQVKGALLLEAVARREDIKVDDSEMTAKMQEVSEMAGVPVEDVQKRYAEGDARRALAARVVEDKVFDFLLEKAQVNEVTKEDLGEATAEEEEG